MASDNFNGSTISVGAADQIPLTGMTFDDSAAEVDVTGCADSGHTYEAGLPNVTLTIETVGVSDLSVGDEGAISVAWNDGSTDTITNGVVTAVSKTGSLDGAISSSVTVRPTGS